MPAAGSTASTWGEGWRSGLDLRESADRGCCLTLASNACHIRPWSGAGRVYRDGFRPDIGPGRSHGRPSCDHLAEPLHVAEQPVAVLRVFLERDIEEDLVDARVIHLLHVLRDLLPGAVRNGASSLVEAAVCAVDEAAHHGDEPCWVAPPLRRRVLHRLHHGDQCAYRSAASREAIGQPSGPVKGPGHEGADHDRRMRLLHGFGTYVRRLQVEVLAVILDRVGTPHCEQALDRLLADAAPLAE